MTPATRAGNLLSVVMMVLPLLSVQGHSLSPESVMLCSMGLALKLGGP